MTIRALTMKGSVGQRVPPGTYSKITLINCKDCVIDGDDGVFLAPLPAATNNEAVIRITGSPGTDVVNLTIVGLPAKAGVSPDSKVLDKTGRVIGLPAGEAIQVYNSDNVKIRSNYIRTFHQGVTFGASRNLSITDNSIGNCRTSPIAGAARDGLSISCNVLLGGHAWRWGFTPGDHGDAVHVWDDTPVINGLEITDNVFDQSGGTPILGIFVQSRGGQFVDGNVSRNKIINSNGQGIVLMEFSGLADSNVLVWSKVPTYRGVTAKDAPRLDVKAGSHDLIVCHTAGPVTVAKGLINVVVRA